jgi:hypothetical protein
MPGWPRCRPNTPGIETRCATWAQEAGLDADSRLDALPELTPDERWRTMVISSGPTA